MTKKMKIVVSCILGIVFWGIGLLVHIFYKQHYGILTIVVLPIAIGFLLCFIINSSRIKHFLLYSFLCLFVQYAIIFSRMYITFSKDSMLSNYIMGFFKSSLYTFPIQYLIVLLMFPFSKFIRSISKY